MCVSVIVRIFSVTNNVCVHDCACVPVRMHVHIHAHARVHTYTHTQCSAHMDSAEYHTGKACVFIYLTTSLH